MAKRINNEVILEMYQLIKDLGNQDSGCGTYSREEVEQMVRETIGDLETDGDGNLVLNYIDKENGPVEPDNELQRRLIERQMHDDESWYQKFQRNFGNW